MTLGRALIELKILRLPLSDDYTLGKIEELFIRLLLIPRGVAEANGDYYAIRLVDDMKEGEGDASADVYAINGAG